MLIIRHSVYTKANAESVWALWTDISSWPKWDHGIESAKLNDSFETNGTGWLKPKGGPKVKFKIVSMEKNLNFHSRSRLPLTKLDFKHFIKKDGDSIVVTHEVEMSGPLSFIFSKIVGANIKKDLPQSMKNLIRLAEGSK